MLSLIATLGLSLLAAAEGPSSSKPKPLPTSEMLARSAQDITEMRQVLQDSLVRLEEARSSKDVVKLNCVNEKLTQEKGLLRISEQADVALQEAVAKKEQMAAEHEFTKVSIADEKVRALRSEAEECIGQLAFRTDQNLTVEVDVPNNIPNSDPTNGPAAAPFLSRPPFASPGQ